MTIAKDETTNVREKIRMERAKTATNLRGQRMFPFVATREHTMWRKELIWLPDASICYTALTALIHERAERSDDWRRVIPDSDMNDLEEEAWLLSELTEVGAISMEVGVYLLVSAHSVSRSHGHGFLRDIESEEFQQFSSNCSMDERKRFVERTREIEEKMLESAMYDLAALLGNNREYRDLVTEEAELAIRYVARWSNHLLDQTFGLPECLITETVIRGKEELNRHMKRERLAIANSLLISEPAD